MTILVTGGAGFIGSNFVHDWLGQCDETVVNLDKLTYAGNVANLAGLENDTRYHFVHGDIGDATCVDDLLARFRPRAIINFAAESHVDRSIHGPAAFIATNVVGTFELLEATLRYLKDMTEAHRSKFRFLHVSTDEVFGSLEAGEAAFSETRRYAPNSPYSASKAASDHLIRAYFRTYGVPVITTNCSNNYGPYQFPEKLIPLVIHNALNGLELPVYGDGMQIRDWLYVADHCSAIRLTLERGRVGQVYNIGGDSEKTNVDVIKAICTALDDVVPRDDGVTYFQQIRFVEDRPGHDRRYAIDSTKIRTELDWKPGESFDTGIRKTINWYLRNREWTDNVASGEYQQWIDTQYGAAG